MFVWDEDIDSFCYSYMTEEQTFWALNKLVDQLCPGYYRYVLMFMVHTQRIKFVFLRISAQVCTVYY